MIILVAVIAGGCHAQRPDIAGDAARLTGLADAIVFRKWPEQSVSGPQAGEVLTIPQAIRLALLHDPRVQSSLAKVRMAEADANQARLLPNPILSLDMRFPLKTGSTAFEPSLSADIITIFQKPAQIRAADHRLRGSAADALTIVLDVIAEVQQAYAACRAADAEISNGEHRRQLLQRLRDIAQRRLDAGEGTRLDVLTLDAQLMQSTLDVEDLRLGRIEQRLILARLIGQPRAVADWQLSPWEAPPVDSMAVESAWVDAALSNRPEILSKTWELCALGDDLSASTLAPFAGTTLGAHGEHDGDWRLGPSLNTPLPILDFGQAAKAKIKAQTVAARHDLAAEQAMVIQEVRLAHASYAHTQRALADARGKLLPLQQQQLEQAQRAYQAGEADLATLLLSQTEMQTTLSKIVELQEKVTVARVKLQRAAGGAGVAERTSAAATQPAETPTSRPATGPTR
jgi:cobalt-zinc-cadmium efflux system outer membrane protein